MIGKTPSAQGRGNFAGYFFNVHNFFHQWHGEGDDMYFIDGVRSLPGAGIRRLRRGEA